MRFYPVLGAMLAPHRVGHLKLDKEYEQGTSAAFAFAGGPVVSCHARLPTLLTY